MALLLRNKIGQLLGNRKGSIIRGGVVNSVGGAGRQLNAEFGIRNAEFGMRNGECGIWESGKLKLRKERKAEGKISHRHTQTHADIKKSSRLKDRRWAVGKVGRCVKDGR